MHPSCWTNPFPRLSLSKIELWGHVLGVVAAVVLFGLLRQFALGKYYMLVREDGPVEWVQALCLSGSLVFAVLSARALFRQGFLLMAGAFGFLGFALFLMTGEELSWGQRLLGFATPEPLLEANTQQEFNAHNFAAFKEWLHWAFIGIGLYAVGARALCRLVSRPLSEGPLGLALPDWYQSLHFVPFLLLYALGRVPPFEWVDWRDLEAAEYFLAVGFLVFTASKWRQIHARGVGDPASASCV